MLKARRREAWDHTAWLTQSIRSLWAEEPVTLDACNPLEQAKKRDEVKLPARQGIQILAKLMNAKEV